MSDSQHRIGRSTYNNSTHLVVSDSLLSALLGTSELPILTTFDYIRTFCDANFLCTASRQSTHSEFSGFWKQCLLLVPRRGCSAVQDRRARCSSAATVVHRPKARKGGPALQTCCRSSCMPMQICSHPSPKERPGATYRRQGMHAWLLQGRDGPQLAF